MQVKVRVKEIEMKVIRVEVKVKGAQVHVMVISVESEIMFCSMLNMSCYARPWALCNMACLEFYPVTNSVMLVIPQMHSRVNPGCSCF